MIALLHNVRSMHNVGAIFRTADATGIEKIYLCGITPKPLDEFGKIRQPITKVALGAESTVAWEYHRKTHELIERFKKQGYTIFAVEQHPKSKPFYSVHLSPQQLAQTVLIFGHERTGISPAILKRVDKILEIPMLGQKESLNVSVAFGILVFSLLYS